MKGKYEVVVKSRRVQYKFSVIRNITILRGDSATGKTTLIDMIAAYQENGEASGVTVISKKQCTVLTGIRWQENLSLIHDSIVSCLLYTSPSPRDRSLSRMPSSA